MFDVDSVKFKIITSNIKPQTSHPLFFVLFLYFGQYVIRHAGSGLDDGIAVLDGFRIEAALILMLLRLGNHLFQLDRLVIDVIHIGAVVCRFAGLFHRIEGQDLAAHIVIELGRVHVDGRILVILPHIIRCEDRCRQDQGKAQGQKHFFQFHR